MANAIIDGINIDLSVFSYSAPKPNPTGGKVVNLYNKYAKESLTISVPLMGSWGAQEVKTLDGTGTGKYTMTLQFSKGQYTTPDADKFLEEMKKVENKIKQDAILYSKEWFGKEIKSMDVMDEKFTPMLKYPKKSKGSEERNYDEPPQLNLKLPCWKGVWQPSVFDEEYNQLYVKGKTDGEVTPLDFLKCPSKAPIQIISLIQCAGLWFVGSPAKVSITWNLKQVIVKKPRTSTISDDTCFLTIKPAEKEALILQHDTESEKQVNDNSISAQVEDSDNEDEYSLPPPPSVKTEQVVETNLTPVEQVVSQTLTTTEETKKKRVVTKKKSDA